MNSKGIAPLIIVAILLVLVVGTFFVVKDVVLNPTGAAITNPDTSSNSNVATITSPETTNIAAPVNTNTTPQTPTKTEFYPYNSRGGGGRSGGSSSPAAEPEPTPVPVITTSGLLTQTISLFNNEGLGTPIVISNSGDTEKTVTLSSISNGMNVSYVGKLNLTYKDTTTWTSTGDSTEITYTVVGNSFEFSGVPAEYTLIYYKDSVVGLNGRLANPQPAVTIVNNIGNLPQINDANLNANYSEAPDFYAHRTGAKLWAVPTGAINPDKTLDWSQMNNFLYETDLISYFNNSNGEIVIPAHSSVTVYPKVTSLTDGLELTKKNTGTWQPLEGAANKINITYTLVGDTFEYDVVSGVIPNGYELVYAMDKENRFTDYATVKTISEINTLNEDLPMIGDWNLAANPDYCDNHNTFDSYNNCVGAKLWIVKTDNIGTEGVLSWANMADYYYETDLITYQSVSNTTITTGVYF